MPSELVLIRPRRSLLTAALISLVLAMIPLFGVLYWLGATRDAWGVVVGLHLAVLLFALVTLIRQLMVHVRVTDTELAGSGILTPLVRVPLDRITEVLLIETYVGQSPTTVRQLLVRDAEGNRLFRLRGNFWHAGDVDRVVAALPVAPVVVSEPMSNDEFFRDYPGSAYWFENRPWLRIALFIVLLIAIALLALWIMALLGLPIGAAR